MNQTFDEYVKEYLSLQLDRAEGLKLYICDMGIELYRLGRAELPQDEKLASEMIFNRFPEDSGEFMDYALQNCEQAGLNPFKRPVAMFILMVEEACDRIMASLPYVQKFRDDEVTLSDKDIEAIKKELVKTEWGGFESC